jgi:hypothetical protein
VAVQQGRTRAGAAVTTDGGALLLDKLHRELPGAPGRP